MDANSLPERRHLDACHRQWSFDLHRSGNLYPLSSNVVLDAGFPNRHQNVVHRHGRYGKRHECNGLSAGRRSSTNMVERAAHARRGLSHAPALQLLEAQIFWYRLPLTSRLLTPLS